MVWFVDDPEGSGYSEYNTEEEAETAAEQCLQHWRDASDEDGEWFECAVLSLRWGKVYGKGRFICDDNDDPSQCDATLRLSDD